MHDRGRGDDHLAGRGLLSFWNCHVTPASGSFLEDQVRQQRPVQSHLDPEIREDLRRALHQHRRCRDDRRPVSAAGELAPSRRAGARRRQRHRRSGVSPGPDLRGQGDGHRPGRGDGGHRASSEPGSSGIGDEVHFILGDVLETPLPREVRHHLEPRCAHAHPRQAPALLAALQPARRRRPDRDHRLCPGQDARLARVRGLHQEDRLPRRRARAVRPAPRATPGSSTSSSTTPPRRSSTSSGARRSGWPTIAPTSSPRSRRTT